MLVPSRSTGRQPVGDEELADCLQVDVGGIAARQGQAGAAAGGGLPGQRLVDAQAGQVPDGAGVQCGAQRGGKGVGEGVIAAAVTGRAERQHMAGVVQVGPGEQLVEVAAGVIEPTVLAGVGAGLVAELLPLLGCDHVRGGGLPAALVVDRAAAGVEMAGEVADRGENRAVAVLGQRPQDGADGEVAAVGVQAGDDTADAGGRVAWHQQARGDRAAERSWQEPLGRGQPDGPLRPQELRDPAGAGGQQLGAVSWDACRNGGGAGRRRSCQGRGRAGTCPGPGRTAVSTAGVSGRPGAPARGPAGGAAAAGSL